MVSSVGNCVICGGSLPQQTRGRKRKICDSPSCKRKYKAQKQAEYQARPEVAAKKAAWHQAHGRERSRRRREQDPDYQWTKQLYTIHRLRPDQWQAMLAEQRGLCYLCERPLPDDRAKIAIDHDHGCCPSGSSCQYCRRGLAHMNCNSAIGLLLDDSELLQIIAINLGRVKKATMARLADRPVQDGLFAQDLH